MKHLAAAGRDKRYVATAFFKDTANLKTLHCLSLRPSSRRPVTAAHPGLSPFPPSPLDSQ